MKVFEVEKKNWLIIKQLKEFAMLEILKKDGFCLAEQQENATYELRYKSTLQKKIHIHVLSHTAGDDDAAKWSYSRKSY